jgi:hypothetical protein
MTADRGYGVVIDPCGGMLIHLDRHIAAGTQEEFFPAVRVFKTDLVEGMVYSGSCCV